jgi:hypothetical protein
MEAGECVGQQLTLLQLHMAPFVLNELAEGCVEDAACDLLVVDDLINEPGETLEPPGGLAVLGLDVDDTRSALRIARLDLREEKVLLRMMALRRVKAEIVEDALDDIEVRPVGTIENSHLLLEDLEQKLHVGVIPTQ